MVNNPKHINPSKEKLLAFVRGELSAKERMDIAKAIEKNPVLEDVVEGLRLSENREKSIHVLEQKIREKYRNKGGAKIISFQSKAILTAAASVLILISFGIYNKMLKLDEARVISEQTFKNQNAPQAILKATEGNTNSEEAIEEENEQSPQTIAPNFSIAEKQQEFALKNTQEKTVFIKEDADKLESLLDETKAPQQAASNTGVAVADGDKDYDSKRDVSGKTSVSDNFSIANAPASSTATTTSTIDIPKREKSAKKKTESYRSAEQAPVAVAEEKLQEKESTTKTLDRTVPDQNDPFNQAISFHNRKNYQAAFLKMDSLAQNQPKNDEYQYYAGAFAYDNKLYDKAINYLEPLSKNTRSKFQESAKWYLALSCKANGEHEKAKKLLKEIAAKNNGYQQLAADSLKAME